MALVTVTFEDVPEGVKVFVTSDPPFPKPEEQDSANLSEAQHMGLRLTHMLTEEAIDDDHECGPDCAHNHNEGIILNDTQGTGENSLQPNE